MVLELLVCSSINTATELPGCCPWCWSVNDGFVMEDASMLLSPLSQTHYFRLSSVSRRIVFSGMHMSPWNVLFEVEQKTNTEISFELFSRTIWISIDFQWGLGSYLCLCTMNVQQIAQIPPGFVVLFFIICLKGRGYVLCCLITISPTQPNWELSYLNSVSLGIIHYISTVQLFRLQH